MCSIITCFTHKIIDFFVFVEKFVKCFLYLTKVIVWWKYACDYSRMDKMVFVCKCNICIAHQSESSSYLCLNIIHFAVHLTTEHIYTHFKFMLSSTKLGRMNSKKVKWNRFIQKEKKKRQLNYSNLILALVKTAFTWNKELQNVVRVGRETFHITVIYIYTTLCRHR